MTDYQFPQRQQKTAFSRSDYARSKASKQNFDKVIDSLSNEIHNELNGGTIVDPNRVLPLIEEKNKILKLKQEADNVFNKLEEIIPPLSKNARLTGDDKEEIRKIAASGRYTQKEIAEQFSITQPAVSEIVRKSDK